MKTVDIIIPTYKPDKSLFTMMDALMEQSYPIHQILIPNTEEKYFQRLVYGTGFSQKYKNVVVSHHSKREFDHGRTRKSAVAKSDADIFICMTQDAKPANNTMVEELVKALENGKTAVSYARQLPREDSHILERLSRQYNYPDEAAVKSWDDVESMGIKAFFCSNVCAAYQRPIYDLLGGFVKRTIFNEDMIFAAGALKAGYQIAYVPKAEVIHSHNYSRKEQFHRNFDLGVSQAEYPDIFGNITSESEGYRFVKKSVHLLRKEGYRNQILPFYISCAYRLIGFKLGLQYKKLPRKFVISCSQNKEYWMKG